MWKLHANIARSLYRKFVLRMAASWTDARSGMHRAPSHPSVNDVVVELASPLPIALFLRWSVSGTVVRQTNELLQHSHTSSTGLSSGQGIFQDLEQPLGVPSLLLSFSLSPSLPFPFIPHFPLKPGGVVRKLGVLTPPWGVCGKLPGSEGNIGGYNSREKIRWICTHCAS